MKYFFKISLTLSLVLLVSCASKPSKFYVLMPLHGHYKQAHDTHIGMGPIHLPNYLKRPQIVTRMTTNQLKINEFHRWSERFVDNIRHVIQQNLQQLIPTSHVNLYPWTLDKRVDYRVDINVTRFDVNEQGHSVLLVHWKITNKAGKKVYVAKTSKISKQIDPNDFATIVKSMNQNLTTLTRQIAHSLRRLSR